MFRHLFNRTCDGSVSPSRSELASLPNGSFFAPSKASMVTAELIYEGTKVAASKMFLLDQLCCLAVNPAPKTFIEKFLNSSSVGASLGAPHENASSEENDMFCAVNSTCKSNIVVDSSAQRFLNAASGSTRVMAALLNYF